MTEASVVLRLLAPFLILLFFAGDLLRTYFSADDFMNLYKYVQMGWSSCRGIVLFWSSTYYRPVGAFLYLTWYHFFGLHALPFKVLVMVLLLVNLVLALYLVQRLLRSKELTALVGILIAYHAAETQLYYSFGTIYDLTCFTFMYGALALYFYLREQNRIPDVKLLLVLVVLEILALDSKEMAIALPLIMVLYEALVSPEARKRDINPRAWGTPCLLGVLVLVYSIGKSGGGSTALGVNPLYRPNISQSAYIESMSHYLDLIFYRNDVPHHKAAVAFLALTTVLMVAVRSRVALFGWLWFLVAFLPLNFIPARSGFVLYIPFVGFGLAIVAFGDELFRRWVPPQVTEWIGPRSVVFFLILGALVIRMDKRYKRVADPVEKRSLILAHDFASDLEREAPNPQKPGRLLLLHDPFDADSWSPMFLPSLLRHDMHLTAARGQENFCALSAALLPQYTEVYDYSEPHLTRIPNDQIGPKMAQVRAQEGYVDPGDGVWVESGQSMWTKRVFTLSAGCPAGHNSCHETTYLALPHETYPGVQVHNITVTVDGGPAQNASLTTDVGTNNVTVPMNGIGRHSLTYTFDSVIPASSHPGDPRELAVLFRGAVVAP